MAETIQKARAGGTGNKKYAGFPDMQYLSKFESH
jgi:hypothetical protein